MKKTVKTLALLAIVIAMLFIVSGCDKDNEELVDTPILQVDSLLRRYGKQETVVLELTNKSKKNIIFPDNQYGLNLFKRQADGTWTQIISPLPVQSTIHILRPNEPIEVIMNYQDLSDGEYRVVFEGWKRDDLSKLIKGETIFYIYPHPTFKAELINKNLKANDAVEIVVTNDRVSTIFFDNSTLNLRMLIKNEAGEWMQLPSPLYNDRIPFNLEPGQNYNIQVPPLRAPGSYRIVMTGHEESGLELRSEMDFTIR